MCAFSLQCILFKAIYSLSLGFPKSRCLFVCVGWIWQQFTCLGLKCADVPLGLKIELKTDKRKRWKWGSKRDYSESTKGECLKIWEKRNWFPSLNREMQRRNIVLQLSSLTPTTHEKKEERGDENKEVCGVKAGRGWEIQKKKKEDEQSSWCSVAPFLCDRKY